MSFAWRDDHRLPRSPDQAIGLGWTAATEHRPVAVTWHWTATTDLATCRRLLGGSQPERQGVASAHYGVGRHFAEGIDRYVSLEDRSWHAGKNQTLRWDGFPLEGAEHKAARTTIGVETVNLGYARAGIPAAADWLRADAPAGGQRMRVQPWPAEQMEMMVAVGKEILDRWPHIGPPDHHGHHDLCPGYKVDPSALPMAELLRRIYDDPMILDVWTPFWTVRQRRLALGALGYDREEAARGLWTPAADQALRTFQADAGLVVDGMWTLFVSREAHARLRARDLDPDEVTSAE